MIKILLVLILSLFVAPLSAQTKAHIDAVAAKQRGSYVVADSTNDCPGVADDLFGWPHARIQYCEYTQGGLKGSVYLLRVPARSIARWIESSCTRQMPKQLDCFRIVLACAVWNSSMMFPISGNIIEGKKNYFFRNGVTVAMPDVSNGSPDQIDLVKQREIARLENSRVESMKSGLARYWRTLPRHLADISPLGTVPKKVENAEEIQRWLKIVQAEILTALTSPSNRLLEAYMRAHPQTLRALLRVESIQEDDCPGEESP